jgi:hypothetical protein
MAALPEDTPVTRPVEDTVALALLLVQTTFWLVALAGVIVATSVSELPNPRARAVLSNDMPVTRTGAGTVIVQTAVRFPSTVVAVILAEPWLMAVTKPSLLTAATVGLLLAQVTLLSEAVVGKIDGTSNSVVPINTVSAVLFRLMPVTLIGGSTVTAHVAGYSPSTVTTVMVAVPGARPFTVPFEDTVAFSLLPDHVKA